ncbi:DUF1287 domain-containing protein [Kangiella sp.]|uniref:DUF1287 domain-containing protein n=1 Tax=Kangiella sp. TaxID=1920245 RepID=UPI0019ACB9FC|nr:DUF1287 domain-containing protein [Kangiella sp.]MBD3653210.1 DUF1287 domain-containing protein [Kangiella sp.]
MKNILLVISLVMLSAPVLAKTASDQLVEAALERTQFEIKYDGRYMTIDYPNGDVPPEIGVCTDVIIRSYRKLGIDLQQLVHEDMRDNFELYPSKRIWGLTSTDRNIDHRRVPNLQAFFSRHGKSLPISNDPQQYQPGDIVSWMLPGNLPHIGIVTDQKDVETGNPLIVHNIGAGPKLENMLFDYDITGHYRYFPQSEE